MRRWVGDFFLFWVGGIISTSYFQGGIPLFVLDRNKVVFEGWAVEWKNVEDSPPFS